MITSAEHSKTLADTWCRMWNDDPTLATELVGDRLAVWFGNPGGDPVTDAATLEAFIVRYRERTPNRFTPRTIVADPVTNRMAYTWDVHLATGVSAAGVTGEDISGIDVNTLDEHGRIVVNWTVTMSALDPHDLPTPPSTPWSRSTLETATHEWLATRGHRADGGVVVDEAAQRAAVCLVTTVGRREVGGLAVLAFGADGEVRAWSGVGSQPPLELSAGRTRR